MATKSKAAEPPTAKERDRGSLKASGSATATDRTGARLKLPSPSNRLPPIDAVDWNGGGYTINNGAGDAPKNNRTKVRQTPKRAASGSRATDATSPKVRLRGKNNGQAAHAAPKTKNAPVRGKAKRGFSTPVVEPSQIQGRLIEAAQPKDAAIDSTCQKLRELQRRKVAALKARIAIDNQLTALVAIELGYSAGLEEKERKALWAKAKEAIKAMTNGTGEKDALAGRVGSVVVATQQASNGFDEYLGRIEKEMQAMAKTLPIVAWASQQRGFGLLSLAAVVGECGDIGSYSGPAALQKRLGLAAIQHNGVTKMPSTWRSSGGLPAEVWSEAGYSPRRRSIMYVIGECLVKQNDGEFRARYDQAKAAAKERHDDWTDGHCHNHAMLLTVKLLVKRLWQRWRGQLTDMPPRMPATPGGSLAAGKAVRIPPKSAKAPSQKQKRLPASASKRMAVDAGVPNGTFPKKGIAALESTAGGPCDTADARFASRAKPVPPPPKTLTAASRTQRAVVAVLPKKPVVPSKAVRQMIPQRLKASAAKIKP
jgi:hypothetical protein